MSPAGLRNRRLQFTGDLEWEGQEFVLSIGFDRDGSVRELFLAPAKSARSLEATVKDASIAISLLLRGGMSIEALRGHLAPEPEAGEAASLLAAAVSAAIAMGAAHPEAIAMAYQACDDATATLAPPFRLAVTP